MSALQRQAISLLDGLSDENLEFIISMITKFMKPEETVQKEPVTGTKIKLGMFKGKEWCAPGYDLDEDNEEIARLFEGME